MAVYWRLIFTKRAAFVPGRQIEKKNTLPKVQEKIILKRIGDIKIGDRVSGNNPDPKEKESNVLFALPAQDELRSIRLNCPKQDGSHLEISLLRSVEWIKEESAEVGKTVYLDMPEFGITEDANVLSIDKPPTVTDGPGNLVTGTFCHTVPYATNLYVEGLNSPIGCTDTHPFWSEDRLEFVPVGLLNIGERLRLFNGESARVLQKLPRPGPTKVYNIEVYGDHVYEVTSQGILVHNICWSTARKNYWTDRAKDPNIQKTHSNYNVQRMKDGQAPQMKVRVENNKTGNVEEKVISMELHHINPQSNTTQTNPHATINLAECTPSVHAVLDPHRHPGYTLLGIVSNCSQFNGP